MRKILGSVERDELNIRREVLLKRKRTLDAIDKLRQMEHFSRGLLKSNLKFFVHSTEIKELAELQKIFDWLASDKTAQININKAGVSSIAGWGSYGVEIKLGRSFEDNLKKIRSEYHLVNNAMEKDTIVRTNSVFGTSVPTKRGNIFVLMPFSSELDKVYEKIIKPTVEERGYSCKRADEIPSNKAIMEDIWKAINEAEIIIADLTGLNPNVMYELGIAHALEEKETILIFQKNEEIKFPFDLAHIRRIEYFNTAVGGKELEKKLIETLGSF